MMKSIIGGFDHFLSDQRRQLEAKSQRGQREDRTNYVESQCGSRPTGAKTAPKHKPQEVTNQPDWQS